MVLFLSLFNNLVLATNVCAPCTSGNYSYANFAGVCPVGSYGTLSGTASCDVCPFGTYLTNQVNSSSSKCTQCSAGRFSSYTTNTTVVQAFSRLSIPIIGGNYTSSMIRMYVSGIGSLLTNIKLGDKIIATQLIFSSSFNDTSLNTSWYSPEMNYTVEMLSLTTSSKLQVRLDVTQRNLMSCQDCQAGSYSSVGASICTLCDVGESSVSGSSACTRCTPGRYAASKGTTECALCDYGKFTYNWPGQSSCYACGIGYYTDQRGSTSCRRCSDGFSSDRGASSCYACAPGSYSSFNETSMWCFPCDAGTYSNSGASVCTNCSAGKYTTGEGEPICQDCLPGRFASNNGSGWCPECPPLAVTPSMGSTTCTTCDPLMSTGILGQVACICKPGYGSIESTRQCEQCTGNTFSVGSIMPCTVCWGVASSDHSKCDCPSDRPILRDQTCLTIGCNQQCVQQPGGCTNPRTFTWTYPTSNSNACPLTSKLLVVQPSQCQGTDPVFAYQWELSNPRAPGYTFGCQTCPVGTWTDRNSLAAYQCNQCQKAPGIGVNITAPAQFRTCSCMAGYGDYSFNLGICFRCPVNSYQPPVNKGGPCISCPHNTFAAPGSSVCKPIVCPLFQYLLPDGYSVADCRPCDSLTTNPVETPLRGCSCKFGYGNFDPFTGQCARCQQPITFSAGGFESTCNLQAARCYDQVYAYSFPNLCQPPLEIPLAGYTVTDVSKIALPTTPGFLPLVEVGRLIPGVSDVSHVSTLCVTADQTQRVTVPWITLQCVPDYDMPNMLSNTYGQGQSGSGSTLLVPWTSQFPNPLPVHDVSGSYFDAQNTIRTRLSRFLKSTSDPLQQMGFTCSGSFVCPATVTVYRQWDLGAVKYREIPCALRHNVQIQGFDWWPDASYFTDVEQRFYFYQKERALLPQVKVVPAAAHPNPFLNPDDAEIGIEIVYGVDCQQCRMGSIQIITRLLYKARLPGGQWITLYEEHRPILDQPEVTGEIKHVQAGKKEESFYDAPGSTQIQCVRDNILAQAQWVEETEFSFDATFYPMFQSAEDLLAKWVPMAHSVDWKTTRRRALSPLGDVTAPVPDTMTWTVTETWGVYPTWNLKSSDTLAELKWYRRKRITSQKTYNTELCWLLDNRAMTDPYGNMV